MFGVFIWLVVRAHTWVCFFGLGCGCVLGVCFRCFLVVYFVGLRMMWLWFWVLVFVLLVIFCVVWGFLLVGCIHWDCVRCVCFGRGYVGCAFIWGFGVSCFVLGFWGGACAFCMVFSVLVYMRMWGLLGIVGFWECFLLVWGLGFEFRGGYSGWLFG